MPLLSSYRFLFTATRIAHLRYISGGLDGNHRRRPVLCSRPSRTCCRVCSQRYANAPTCLRLTLLVRCACHTAHNVYLVRFTASHPVSNNIHFRSRCFDMPLSSLAVRAFTLSPTSPVCRSRWLASSTPLPCTAAHLAFAQQQRCGSWFALTPLYRRVAFSPQQHAAYCGTRHCGGITPAFDAYNRFHARFRLAVRDYLNALLIEPPRVTILFILVLPFACRAPPPTRLVLGHTACGGAARCLFCTPCEQTTDSYFTSRV